MNSIFLTLKDILNFPDIRLNAFRIWKRNFVFFYRNFLSSLFWITFEPVLYFLAFGVGLGNVVGKIEGMPYWIFFAPSIIGITAMLIPFYETSYKYFDKSKKGGIFENLRNLPIERDEIFVGDLLWAITKGVMSAGLLTLVFYSLGFIHAESLVFIFPLIALTSWLFASFGLMIATFVSDARQILFTQMIIIVPMSVLAGTFFPLSVYPEFVFPAPYVAPLTILVEQIRSAALMSFQGSNFLVLVYPLGLSVVFTNISISRASRSFN